MRKIVVLGVGLLLLVLGVVFFNTTNEQPTPVVVNSTTVAPTVTENVETVPAVITETSLPPPLPNGYEVVVEKLSIPWDIAFIEAGAMLVTERAGRVLWVKADGTIETVLTNLGDAKGEGGLLGITLHPDFATNGWVYLYLTKVENGVMSNHIERYFWNKGTLTNPQTILANIPGALYHDGGRMEFGPDGYLYVAVGDATSPESAQNLETLTGSILRLTESGEAAPGNPFSSRIYSYGHRNPQGLAWDDAGRLWSTEHGRSGVLSGFDEINYIVAGGNYGWPESEGDTVVAGTQAPTLHSGAKDTWAPASALYYKGSLFFAGLRGEALYEAILNDDQVVELKEHFTGVFGRLRTIRLGPDGYFYLTTSNRDGRGSPYETDDRIIRIDPAFLKAE